MKISIAYDLLRFEEKSLYVEAQKNGYEVSMLHVDESHYDLMNLDFGESSVLLQRCVSHTRGLHIAAIAEAAGVPTLNTTRVTLLCDNKALTTLSLAKAGIPTPRTILAFDVAHALDALDKIGYPAVIKPVVGSWGRQVVKVRDREEASAVLEARSANNSPTNQIYYIQEFVKRPNRDIRAIFVGDEIITTVYRYQPEGDWRTNVARGGRSEKAVLKKEDRELIFRAAEAVGGGILGIDAMESPSGILIHEVNSTVEFRGASTASDVNIPLRIIQYAQMVGKK